MFLTPRRTATLAIALVGLLGGPAIADGTVDDLRVGSIVAVETETQSDGTLHAVGVAVLAVSQPEWAIEAQMTAVDLKKRTVTLLGREWHIPKGTKIVSPKSYYIDIDKLELGWSVGLDFQADEQGNLTLRMVETEIYAPEDNPLGGEFSGVAESLDLVGGSIKALGMTAKLTKDTKFETDFESFGPMILAGVGIDRWSGAALLNRFSTTSDKILQNPDGSGLAYCPATKTLIVADSEIEDGPLFFGSNAWEMALPSGKGVRGINTLQFCREPTGIAWHPGRKTFFVSDDDKKQLFEFDAKLEKLVGGFDTSRHGVPDPEGVSVDPKTGNVWVAGGAARDIICFSPEGELKSRFNIAKWGAKDPEGLAFDESTGNLLAVSGPNLAVFEFTQAGRLVGTYSLVYSGALGTESGTFAPTSDPTDDPEAQSLYIAAGMTLAEMDGRIYEYELCRPPFGAKLRRDYVGDKDGFGFKGSETGFAKADRNGNKTLDLNENIPDMDGKNGIDLHGGDAFDHRSGDHEGPTDMSLNVTESEPVRLVHSFDASGGALVRGRLTMVAADSRSLPGYRVEVFANGHCVGELLGASGVGFFTGDGAIVRSTFELPTKVLKSMTSGKLVIELRRAAGTGDDDLAIDYSLLEYGIQK